jgi:hypothetical protein
MKVVRLASALALAAVVMAVFVSPPAQAASVSSQYKIKWRVVNSKLLFNKKETEKLGAGAGTVAAMGALLPPPFDIVVVSISAAIAGGAASAAIDGKCVGLKVNPPLPFMPMAIPFIYSPSKTGDGRYCK